MRAPRTVIIDGVHYVPVLDAVPGDVMDAVARGLLMQFWGCAGDRVDLERKLEGLRVIVTDEGPHRGGDPIQETLAAIAREIAEQRLTKEKTK